ncbi:GLUG motif-containing protein, partial [Aliarcobacter butzleri]|uniref:GLUG motif-containing protein n=1 Tax=Aliarcobacter butzleri TaxID=28197 RepID=UPI0024492F67
INVNATINNTNKTNGGVYFNAANNQSKVVFGADGKVIVNNVYQLQWINTALDGKYELGSNIDAGVTSSWNSGEGFSPIGYDFTSDNNSMFTGTFDGKGFTISNLFIDRLYQNNIGLFGYTIGSTIKNLGLVNVNIAGYSSVGGLVGNNDGTIQNSYVTGVLISNLGLIGGLVGFNGRNGTIDNSYANVNVSGDLDAGGLVGNNEATIKNSYATVIVNGNNNSGGLIGWNGNGIIENSYASGYVNGNNNSGGLIGWNGNGTIENSYANVNVSGSSYVGGLIGYSQNGTIINSFYNVEYIATGIGNDLNNTGVKGKTIAELQNKATFTNWNIIEDNTLTKGYPILAWQKNRNDYIWLIGTNTGRNSNPNNPKPTPNNEIPKVVDNIEQITNSTSIAVNNYIESSFGSENSQNNNLNLNQNSQTLALNDRVGVKIINGGIKMPEGIDNSSKEEQEK